jgi:hypothetical protein
MSEKSGISVKDLSDLSLSALKGGTDIGSMTMGLKFLAAQMLTTSEATDKQKTVLGALGISVTDANGKLRPFADILPEIADKFAGMENGAVKVRLAVALFGRAGMEMIPVLNGGSKGFAENAAKAKLYGTELNERTVKAAEDFKNAQIDLSSATTGLGRTIGESLMPVVKTFIEDATDAVVKIREWADASPVLTTALTSMALSTGVSLTVMGTMLLTIPKLVTSFQAFAKILAITKVELALTMAEITAFVAGAVMVYTAVETIIKAKEDEGNADLALSIKNDQLEQTLWNAAKAAGYTRDQFNELTAKYNGNNEILSVAIKKGKEGADIQAALSKEAKIHVQALKDQLAAAAKLDPALKAVLDALDKGSKTIKTAAEALADLAKNTTVTHASIAILEKAFTLASASGKILTSDLKPIVQSLVELKTQAGERVPTALIILAGGLKDTTHGLGEVEQGSVLWNTALFDLGIRSKDFAVTLTNTLLPQVERYSGLMLAVIGNTAGFTTAAETLSVELKTKLVEAFNRSVLAWQALSAAGELTKEENKRAIEEIITSAHNLGIKFSELPADVQAASKKIAVDWGQLNAQIVADFIKSMANCLTGVTTFREGFKALGTGLISIWIDMLTILVSKAVVAGTSIGAAFTAMLGPIGIVIAAIGVVVSVLSSLYKSAGEKASELFQSNLKKIQQDFEYLGKITDETAGKIVKMMMVLGDSEAVAVAKELGEMMKETGIDAHNFDIYLSKATNTLTLYKQGALSAADASAAADDQFTQLLAAAQKLGKGGSVALVGFIVKAREMGLQIASVTQYVQGQLQKIPDALGSMISAMPSLADTLKPLNDELAKENEALTNLTPGTQAYKDMEAAIQATTGKISESTIAFQNNANTIGEVKNAGVLAVATFKSMVDSGMSWGDALKAMGPDLAALKQKYIDLGQAADPALQELMNIAQVREAHKDLFNAIDANLQIMQALGNTGYLTADALAAVEKNAEDYYQNLRDAGTSADDSTRAMLPTLQAIYDAHEKSGVVIDADTQKLIDQAKALGLIKETTPDPGTVMATGLDRVATILIAIADKLGADIPAAVRVAASGISTNLGTAVSDTSTDITNKMGGALIGITDGPVADLIDGAKKVGSSFQDAADDATKRWDEGLTGINDGPVADLINNAKTARDAWRDAAKEAKKEWDGIGDGTGNGNNGGGGGGHSYASGGIAWYPQIASVAEHGPEIILPLPELGRWAAGLQTKGTSAGGAMGAASSPQVFIRPILIDKGDKWMIKFIQENIDHGVLRTI